MASTFADLLTTMPEPARRVAVAALRPVVRAATRYDIGPDALKRWLWYSVGKSFAWESHPFVARTRHGFVIEGNTEDILEQYLYFFGTWEPDVTAWMLRRLAPGDVFVDVGANVGYYSLLASRQVGEHGGVVAVEASPEIHGRLQCNLTLNRASNVRPVLMVADRAPGEAVVYEGPTSHRGLTTVVPEPGFLSVATVPADTIIGILTADEAARARVVKVDVEGAELAVVEGLEPLLDIGRRDLEVIVEIGPERLTKQGLRAADVVSVFTDAGFHPYVVDNDYGEWRYLSPADVRAPVRLDREVDGELDIVFSRIDASYL